MYTFFLVPAVTSFFSFYQVDLNFENISCFLPLIDTIQV